MPLTKTGSGPSSPLDSSWAKKAPQHEPRRRIYRFWREALRSIANNKITVNRWRLEDIVCRDRHAEVIGEMVHISALQRLGQKISIGGRVSRYAPKNLVTVLNRIKATYTGNAPEASTEIKVVNWDGRWFDPRDAADQSSVLRIVRAAQDGLSTSRLVVAPFEVTGDPDGSSSGRNGRRLNL